jgi:hypothetical protein
VKKLKEVNERKNKKGEKSEAVDDFWVGAWVSIKGLMARDGMGSGRV